MELIQVIESKKLGRSLTGEEIVCFAQAAADPSTPDYQLSALLMAIRLNGMDARETAELTLAMAHTGDMLKPDVGGVAVDKHSTGGVGDTTTLILVPLVAACGGKVIKMSGRGLGHTGGTIDKMESIRGMRTELDEEEAVDIVRRVGCCVAAQSGELAPADKRLYALRDVTSTVDSIPLIASSVMSKKLAMGADGIVLDIKVGGGALMRTLPEALELGRTMVEIGRHAGRRVAALITGMEEPLGSHIGNALEVKEAIDVLAGRVKGPLLDVSLLLGEKMLELAGLCKDAQEGRDMLIKALESGAGLEKLRQMIEAQGGLGAVVDDTGLLPRSRLTVPVMAEEDGFVAAIDALEIGLAARGLGAGRARKEDVIDPAVGLVLHCRVGDEVRRGDTLGVIHANDILKGKAAAEALRGSIRLSPKQQERPKLLYAVVTAENTQIL